MLVGQQRGLARLERLLRRFVAGNPRVPMTIDIKLGATREGILTGKYLGGVPEGPICGQRPIKLAGQVKIKSGHAYAALESPRGELGTYVAKRDNVVDDNLKIRPPSLHALSAVPWTFPGHTLSDAIAILGSLDPIMGEVDR